MRLPTERILSVPCESKQYACTTIWEIQIGLRHALSLLIAFCFVPGLHGPAEHELNPRSQYARTGTGLSNQMAAKSYDFRYPMRL